VLLLPSLLLLLLLLPPALQDLKHTMAGLLRLHMSLQNETLGDEQVGSEALRDATTT
jgi:hypothetical protein